MKQGARRPRLVESLRWLQAGRGESCSVAWSSLKVAVEDEPHLGLGQRKTKETPCSERVQKGMRSCLSNVTPSLSPRRVEPLSQAWKAWMITATLRTHLTKTSKESVFSLNYENQPGQLGSTALLQNFPSPLSPSTNASPAQRPRFLVPHSHPRHLHEGVKVRVLHRESCKLKGASEEANEFSLPVTAAALAGHDSKRVGVHHHQRTLPILFSTSNLPSLSSDRCGPSLSGLPSPVVAGRPTISPPELARTPFPLHHEAGKAQRRSSVVSLVRSATRLRPSVPPALAGSQVPEKEGLSVGIKAVARGGIGRLGCARGARKGVRAGA